MATNTERAPRSSAEERSDAESAARTDTGRRDAALRTVIAVPQIAWLALLGYLAYRIVT